MTDKQNLNKSLNRTLRSLNEITKLLADCKPEEYEQDLEKAIEATELISHVQKNLYKASPELAWHYEKDKQDTPFMAEIRLLLKKAKALEEKNDVDGTLEVLQRALQLEPPPVQYEVIESESQRIQSIR